MKRSQYFVTLRNYEQELANQDAKKSTGSRGKLADVIVRDYILLRGISREAEVRCRRGGIGSVDVTRRGIGRFEIKTGSGAVAYGYDFSTEDLIPENVCAEAEYVVWNPFPHVSSIEVFKAMIPDTFWVFTRQEFINCLEYIGKKGLRSSLHVTKNGGQINIQTISPAMEERLWEVLENIPTLREWKEGEA